MILCWIKGFGLVIAVAGTFLIVLILICSIFVGAFYLLDKINCPRTIQTIGGVAFKALVTLILCCFVLMFTIVAKDNVCQRGFFNGYIHAVKSFGK